MFLTPSCSGQSQTFAFLHCSGSWTHCSGHRFLRVLDPPFPAATHDPLLAAAAASCLTGWVTVSVRRDPSFFFFFFLFCSLNFFERNWFSKKQRDAHPLYFL
ncbi:hypothetical protein BVRB_3g048560 [Beta vulgaris subsp. vulgaris]|nr:hypothetical protein BVRB_3g048560 [Beta vulgaris subsp. vulgaris]